MKDEEVKQRIEQSKGVKVFKESQTKIKEEVAEQESEKSQNEYIENAHVINEIEDQILKDIDIKVFRQPPSKHNINQSKKSSLSKIKDNINVMNATYPKSEYPDKVDNVKEFLRTYLSNLLKDKVEEKHKKINKLNARFKETFENVKGGIDILLEVGFVDMGDHLIISKYDTKFIEAAIKLLD